MPELIQGQLENYNKARRRKDISLPLLHLVGNVFNLSSRLLFHRCFWRLDDFFHDLRWRGENGHQHGHDAGERADGESAIKEFICLVHWFVLLSLC